MEAKQNPYSEFIEDTTTILDVLEICIERFGLPEAAKDRINDFFDTPYEEENEVIIKRISSIYMEFLGKTNFREKNDPNNKMLHEGLLAEISKLRLELIQE